MRVWDLLEMLWPISPEDMLIFVATKTQTIFGSCPFPSTQTSFQNFIKLSSPTLLKSQYIYFVYSALGRSTCTICFQMPKATPSFNGIGLCVRGRKWMVVIDFTHKALGWVWNFHLHLTSKTILTIIKFYMYHK